MTYLWNVIPCGLTSRRNDFICRSQWSAELIASAESSSDCSIFPSTWVYRVLPESKRRPSLARERKKLNYRKEGRHSFPIRGFKLWIVCAFRAYIRRTSQTSNRVAPLAGWEAWLEWRWAWGEIGSSCIQTYCTNLDPQQKEKHEASWDRQHVIQHDAVFGSCSFYHILHTLYLY